MHRRFILPAALIVVGLTTACSGDQVEEYPDSDEVPVTEPSLDASGAAQGGVDTMLSPVTEPPSGPTPP